MTWGCSSRHQKSFLFGISSVIWEDHHGAHPTRAQKGSVPLIKLERIGHSPLAFANVSPALWPPSSCAPSPLPFTDDRAHAYFQAPLDPLLHQWSRCRDLVAQHLQANDGKITDVLWLGVGGSSLGAQALIQALGSLRRFHFWENIDPLDWEHYRSRLSPQTTLTVLVSKSGETYETLLQALNVLRWLPESRWRDQVICMTEPGSNSLRRFAQTHRLSTVDLDPQLGGRFGVVGAMGSLSLALGGHDGEAFIHGALEVRAYLQAALGNGVWSLVHNLVSHHMTHPVHVCWVYCSRLRAWAQWWSQLWAESLGKKGLGFTPLVAVGTTDQHSLLQLLREGPDDKVSLFIEIEDFGPLSTKEPDFPWIDLPPQLEKLRSWSFGELLHLQASVTQRGLQDLRRPTWSVRLDRLDARSLGALCFWFCVLTHRTADALSIDPFNQPGVESGKRAIAAALSLPRI